MLQDNPDTAYMRLALREAEQAAAAGEVPVGALVVFRNRIVARAHNLTGRLGDATAHAEMQALTAAQETLGSRMLSECTLYVTLEPCAMCAGACYWTRVGRIVAGASDPKSGFLRFGPGQLHPKTDYVQGVEADASTALLQAWFRERRS
jgi:tRNA(adenine34) deaminase